MFSEEFIYKHPDDIGWMNNLKLFDVSILPYLITLSAKESIEILKLITRIRTELLFNSDVIKESIILNLLKVLLLSSERIKRNQSESDESVNMDLSFIEDFKNKLESNYFNHRSVNYYADQLHISAKKLNQLIKSHWGKSAKSIIEERVILEMKRLLKYSNLSAKEISNYLGFNDPTNFNKFCKKHLTLTPSSFRESNKNHF